MNDINEINEAIEAMGALMLDRSTKLIYGEDIKLAIKALKEYKKQIRYREVLEIISATSIDVTSISLANTTLNEEFKIKPCDYCNDIKTSTPASPRHKYEYCPMCGQRLDEEVENEIQG